MPRISDALLNCAVYVYGSLSDARVGERHGGSGLIVNVPVKSSPGSAWPYIVTNRHVLTKAVNPVVRIDRIDGTAECFETNGSQWIGHPDGDDIVVLPLGFDHRALRFAGISIRQFLTKELVIGEDVGIGDDTFIVGRFISHDGKQCNSPAIRFGNIAMMPLEPIACEESGVAQESFLVETRSSPGCSGSAVFLYSPCAMNDMTVRRLDLDKSGISLHPRESRETHESLDRKIRAAIGGKGPYLLGIDCCHLKYKTKVLGGDGQETGNTFSENTGMAAVIPAWRIAEILDSEELMKIREEMENDWLKRSSVVNLD